MPKNKEVELVAADKAPAAGASAEPETSSDWKTKLENFQTLEAETGYMKAAPFLCFLERAESERIR